MFILSFNEICHNNNGDDMSIYKQIKQYIPYNEQEQKDKQVMLATIGQPDILTRKNQFCHFTASAWVLNQRKDKILMVYHNIYGSWSWMGGHSDGNENLLDVAVKEVKEESGLQNVTVLDDHIFSLEILTVDGHEKKGIYVPSHLHLNVTYLLQGNENDILKMKEDENKGVQWFSFDEVCQVSSESWFQERIYKKLNQKVKKRYNEKENL